MDDDLKRKLAALVDGPVLWDCPLREYTSFAIGGPAAALVMVETPVELQRLLVFLGEQKIAWRIIGKGTNLLVSDSGFDGVILILGKGFATIELVSESVDRMVVHAGAGVSLARLVGWCGDQGCAGLEFTAGIPGTVGGAVMMNAGAWGREMADVLASVTVVTPAGEILVLPRTELDFGYRIWHNSVQEKMGGGLGPVVAGVALHLAAGDPERIRGLCRSYREKRRIRQPGKEPNAGSFFKNPQGAAAGRLIEASGLKGMKVGGAMVSPVHANFLVNCGGATAADVVALMKKVQTAVHRDSGILLEPEVHFL